VIFFGNSIFEPTERLVVSAQRLGAFLRKSAGGTGRSKKRLRNDRRKKQKPGIAGLLRESLSLKIYFASLAI
jgi:hypothetical protein